MKMDNSQPQPNGAPARRSRWPWILSGGCVLVVLLALRQTVFKDEQPVRPAPVDTPQRTAASQSRFEQSRSRVRSSSVAPAQTAEEIVTNKVAQFARNRREILRQFAEFTEVQVPAEVERFFELAEAGEWNQLTNAFESLKKLRDTDRRESFRLLWPVVLETFGVAEVAHDWPAQKLLDYGDAMLGPLQPGAVYVGGTDAGRFIPTLLNETTDGERHIVVTQNALADGRYLDYIRFLHGEKLETLAKEDSQRAFNEYLTDAQKRLQHDTQFPNEPKQLRPGEDIRMTENRVQVSGQVAVMSINGRLFQMLVDKNPAVAFAIEQPFPEFGNSNPSRSGEIVELQTPEEFRDWIKQWEEAKKK